LSEIHRKNIALEQINGIRLSLKEAVIRNQLEEDKAEEITKLLDKPSELIENEKYQEAASAIVQVLNTF
jgi:hypothetical protein